MKQDAAHDQRIEVRPATDGWIVVEGERTAGTFDTAEAAYKAALAICDTLFERGIRARVHEAPARPEAA